MSLLDHLEDWTSERGGRRSHRLARMQIRDAVATDAERLAEVHVASWRDAYRGMLPDAYLDAMTPDDRLPSWQERLAQPDPAGCVLVAEGTDDRLHGFASLVPHEHLGAEWALVPQLYLRPTAWGQGLGQALMAELIARAGKLGYRWLELWVHPANARARRFYEAGGWTSDGTEVIEHAWGIDLPGVRYTRPTEV